MPESTLWASEAVASCGGTLEAPMPELEVINEETEGDAHTTDDHVVELGNAPQDAFEPTAERVPLLVATSCGHNSSSADCSTVDGFIDIADGEDLEHQIVCNIQATDQHNVPAPTGRIQAAVFLLWKLRR